MSFSLSPMQIKSIQESTARQNLWCGSVRSGKTFSSILRFIGLCKSLPPGDALICGVSRETIQRNVINLLCDLTGCPLPSSKSSHFKLMGRLIHLVGAPDESAVRRIKGSTLVLAYIDELTDIPEPFYTMILSRLSIDQAKLIATTNPEGPQHWLKKKVIDDETINFKMFQFSLDDNPSLPDSYKEEIKKEYSGVWYERYIMGQWSRAEGLCFDAFDPSVHVVDSIKRPPGYKIVGVDYGTTNPTACYLIDIRTNMWPQIYIEKEYYFDPEKTGYSKTDAELADDIYDFLKLHEIETVYVDPAAASFKLELTRKGLPVANANNDVLQRIKVGNKFFHQVNIVINSGCKNLIDQLQSYSWDKKASERGEDKPVKKDDHGVDSAFYAILSRFPNGELEEFYDQEMLDKLYNEAMRELNAI